MTRILSCYLHLKKDNNLEPSINPVAKRLMVNILNIIELTAMKFVIHHLGTCEHLKMCFCFSKIKSCYLQLVNHIIKLPRKPLESHLFLDPNQVCTLMLKNILVDQMTELSLSDLLNEL